MLNAQQIFMIFFILALAGILVWFATMVKHWGSSGINQTFENLTNESTGWPG